MTRIVLPKILNVKQEHIGKYLEKRYLIKVWTNNNKAKWPSLMSVTITYYVTLYTIGKVSIKLLISFSDADHEYKYFIV